MQARAAAQTSYAVCASLTARKFTQSAQSLTAPSLRNLRKLDGARLHPGELFLLGDDLVLDAVVERLGDDLFLVKLILSLVGPALDDRLGAHIADALQRDQLLLRRRVD